MNTCGLHIKLKMAKSNDTSGYVTSSKVANTALPLYLHRKPSYLQIELPALKEVQPWTEKRTGSVNFANWETKEKNFEVGTHAWPVYLRILRIQKVGCRSLCYTIADVCAETRVDFASQVQDGTGPGYAACIFRTHEWQELKRSDSSNPRPWLAFLRFLSQTDRKAGLAEDAGYQCAVQAWVRNCMKKPKVLKERLPDLHKVLCNVDR